MTATRAGCAPGRRGAGDAGASGGARRTPRGAGGRLAAARLAPAPSPRRRGGRRGSWRPQGPAERAEADRSDPLPGGATVYRFHQRVSGACRSWTARRWSTTRRARRRSSSPTPASPRSKLRRRRRVDQPRARDRHRTRGRVGVTRLRAPVSAELAIEPGGRGNARLAGRDPLRPARWATSRSWSTPSPAACCSQRTCSNTSARATRSSTTRIRWSSTTAASGACAATTTTATPACCQRSRRTGLAAEHQAAARTACAGAGSTPSSGGKTAHEVCKASLSWNSVNRAPTGPLRGADGLLPDQPRPELHPVPRVRANAHAERDRRPHPARGRGRVQGRQLLLLAGDPDDQVRNRRRRRRRGRRRDPARVRPRASRTTRSPGFGHSRASRRARSPRAPPTTGRPRCPRCRRDTTNEDDVCIFDWDATTYGKFVPSGPRRAVRPALRTAGRPCRQAPEGRAGELRHSTSTASARSGRGAVEPPAGVRAARPPQRWRADGPDLPGVPVPLHRRPSGSAAPRTPSGAPIEDLHPRGVSGDCKGANYALIRQEMRSRGILR